MERGQYQDAFSCFEQALTIIQELSKTKPSPLSVEDQIQRASRQLATCSTPKNPERFISLFPEDFARQAVSELNGRRVVLGRLGEDPSDSDKNDYWAGWESAVILYNLGQVQMQLNKSPAKLWQLSLSLLESLAQQSSIEDSSLALGIFVVRGLASLDATWTTLLHDLEETLVQREAQLGFLAQKGTASAA